MYFYEIEFPLADLDAQAVEAALFAIGAHSITFVDGGDEPVLEPGVGEMRLWSDTRVRALFDAGDEPGSDATRRLGVLSASLGARITQGARVRGVADQAWERVWLKDWTTQRFGPRLHVVPTHEAAPADASAVVVWLDPGLAFGTGTHPTTALCLEALARLPLTGRSLIDYGCGSGILGIAALKLGAAHVTAVDIDSQALLATAVNAQRNEVAGALTTRQPGVPLLPADCVVANILAGPLVGLAPVLTAACVGGADLILSGILGSQADDVTAAYAAEFAIVSVTHRDDWCCLHLRRGPNPTLAGAT